MVKPWFVTAFGFGLAAFVAREIRCHIQKRCDAVDLKEEVQRWEGEGGQVPGGTLGAPATAPTADNPKSYSATT